jgi:hypothetical protein
MFQEHIEKMEQNHMSTNGISTPAQAVTTSSRRRKILTYGLALRLLIAFVISWLIVLGFFITGAVSR